MPCAALAALALATLPPWFGASGELPGGPRAAAVTRPLLGAPYVRSALGEGAGPDANPRFRLDAFDCMTFVETAVALASAATRDEALVALDDVRYSGLPRLATRNHEVLSQWIPANVGKGWIEEVTSSIAGPLARRAEKVYTPGSWALVRAAGRAVPGLPRARLPLGRFAVDYVATPDVAAIARRVPEGAIAFVVRADAPDRATRITHAGIVVPGPGGAVHVRHATSSRGSERVIEETIERFLVRQQRALPRWPMDGLAFFAIRDNRARLAVIARGGALPVGAPADERPLAAPPSRL
jgi:hypothetical protein